MVRNSRFELKNEVLEKLFGLFFEVVGKKDDKLEFKKIINDLLTPAERLMIAKRIAIIYLLLKKINYKDICLALKVSAATVAKFKLLMENSQGIVQAFGGLILKDKIVIFMEDVFNTLFPPGGYGVNWKTAWQRKFELERKKTLGL